VGEYIELIGACMLTAYAIIFFISESLAKDENISSTAIKNQVFLLIAGLGMFVVDWLGVFGVSAQADTAIIWRISYCLAILIGGNNLIYRFAKKKQQDDMNK
jgi:hypothetical protein